MTRYTVSVTETILHVIDVEAENEEEAGNSAIATVIEDDRSFFMEVKDRSVYLVLEQK